MIKKIIKQIQNNFNCRIIRNKSLDLNKDIDIMCSKENINNLIKFFKNENFILFNEKNNLKKHFFKFENDNLIHIDTVINTNYLTKYFNIKSKISLLEDTKESKFLRYLITLRKDKLNFFIKNKKEIISNNYYLHNLEGNLFRFKLSYNILIKIIKGSFWYRLLFFKTKLLFRYYYQKLKNYFVLVNKGQIISFLGPDGVGKSTIIETLSDKLKFKSIYMGGKNYRLEKYYNKYEDLLILKIPIFLLRYLENWIRYIKIFYWKFKNNIVLVDRYPKWGLVLDANSKKINIFLHNIFYKYIFPSSTKTIILTEDSEKILKRKQELNLEQIKIIQRKLKNLFFKKKNSFFIKNNRMDDTFNKVLKTIYEK